MRYGYHIGHEQSQTDKRMPSKTSTIIANKPRSSISSSTLRWPGPTLITSNLMANEEYPPQALADAGSQKTRPFRIFDRCPSCRLAFAPEPRSSVPEKKPSLNCKQLLIRGRACAESTIESLFLYYFRRKIRDATTIINSGSPCAKVDSCVHCLMWHCTSLMQYTYFSFFLYLDHCYHYFEGGKDLLGPGQRILGWIGYASFFRV